MVPNMHFGEFIEQYGDLDQFFEFKELDRMKTDHIEFEGSGERSEIDDQLARESCQESFDYSWESSDHEDELDMVGVHYQDSVDDPEYSPPYDIDDWLYENPEPDRKDYEEGDDGQEEYDAKKEEWSEQHDGVEDEIRTSEEEWQRKMDNIEARREEYLDEIREQEEEEYVDNCMDNQREEHDDNDDNGGVLTYTWEGPDGDSYTVEFTNGSDSIPASLGGGSTEDVWTIDFQGPAGHNTTGKNRGAIAIYSELIAATKKLTQDYTVNGFTFTAAEPGMGIIYKKFFDRYMKDDFMAVTPSVFLSKEIIGNRLKNMTPEQQQVFHNHIAGVEQDIQDKLTTVRSEKAAARELQIKLETVIKQLTTIIHPRRPDEQHPGIIMRADAGRPYAVSLVNGEMQSAFVDWTMIKPEIQLDASVWQQFVMKLKERVDAEAAAQKQYADNPSNWHQPDREPPTVFAQAWELPSVQAIAQKYNISGANSNNPQLGQPTPAPSTQGFSAAMQAAHGLPNAHGRLDGSVPQNAAMR
jgi:hypothetical protein